MEKTKEKEVKLLPVLKAICQHCNKEFDSKEQLDTHLARLREVGPLQDVINLEFQNLIDPPEQYRHQARHQAASGDTITSDSWRDQWLRQIKENCKTYNIWKQSVGELYGKSAYKPVIIAGSGPSLKKNAHVLKDHKGNINLVSCLHNFAYFIDNDIEADYYLTLDAGDITLKDIVEGGKEDPEYYWKKTKDHTLLAALVTHPELLRKWQGKILFFNTGFPDHTTQRDMEEITDFNIIFQTGGNALGACFYAAKAVLGGNPICFIGADFAFSHDKKFYPWDGPNQKFAGVIPAINIFGIPVYTWQSYKNFADWFVYVAMGASGGTLPGTYVNCTEGGILGATREGNIRKIPPMNLITFLNDYNCFKNLEPAIKDKKKIVLF